MELSIFTDWMYERFLWSEMNNPFNLEKAASVSVDQENEMDGEVSRVRGATTLL